jgi:hypothetical protein
MSSSPFPASPASPAYSDVGNRSMVPGLPEGVLPFVRKAYEILSDETFSSIISWSLSGTSFVVHDTTDFSDHVLPRYFKHRNFCSFVRQLNTYGFAKADTKTWEFQHELFRRDAPEALALIKRRKPSKRPASPPSARGSPSAWTALDLSGGSLPSDADLVSAHDLRAAHASLAASAQSTASALTAERAHSAALAAQLCRYQALASSLVGQVSAGDITFPSHDAEKAFLSSVVSVLLSEPVAAPRTPAPPVPYPAANSASVSPARSPTTTVPSSPPAGFADLDYGLPSSASASPPASPDAPDFGVDDGSVSKFFLTPGLFSSFETNHVDW